MNKIKYILLAALILIFQPFAQAQSEVEMADLMRTDGKIYVVVAVLLIIFIGLIVYLINLDRKVSKLEKK
ncbi:MAG: CcmD family protein [Sphingobacteriaceae bacterium]|nr:CcmD family protein [Sphingobacteriaceae bacterium]